MHSDLGSLPTGTDVSQPGPDNPAFPRWVSAACILFVVFAALHGADKPIANGDAWLALACGRLMRGPWAMAHENRTWQMKLLDKVGIHISKQDLFSTKSRPPGERDDIRSLLQHSSGRSPRNVGWVNQNWLNHLAFYELSSHLGANAIVGLLFLQAILIALTIYWTARVLGAHPVLAAAATAFAMLLSRPFIDLRAHVTTSLCVAVMFLLLAYWRRGTHWAIALMIPVLVVWSNAHGGFIYAILVFGVLCGAHLAEKLLGLIWPTTFASASWRGLAWLIAGLLLTVLVPAIASPFGQENLFHPLIVALGQEGKLWRTVAEWKPITQKGFGNVKPYFFFLGTFAIAAVMWLMAYVRKPRPRRRGGRRGRRITAELVRPRLDLAQYAVIVMTVAMSVESRRFVFLAGVVLAPFLARIVQETLTMRAARSAAEGKTSVAASLAAGRLRLVAPSALVASVVVMVGVFALGMWDIYFRPAYDGARYSVFQRMAVIRRQPVTPAKFLAENGLSGLVFNEWTGGGYHACSQTSDPETGRPACQVFIDGRAQAAYDADHYRHWLQLRGVNRRSDVQPGKVDTFLKKQGVSIAVLNLGRSAHLFNLLLRSQNWMPVCVADEWVVVLRKDAPQNKKLLRGSSRDVYFPDEHTKKLSVATVLSLSAERAMQERALEMLTSMETNRSTFFIFEMVHKVGRQLGRVQELIEYFTAQRRHFKEQVDRGERFSRATHLEALMRACRHLQRLARSSGDPRGAAEYAKQVEHYSALRRGLGVHWLW